MRSIAVRRTALAASAATLALLATACGGSSDGESKGDGGKPADKTASAAPAKTLSAAELEKVALAQKDVKSGKVVTEVVPGDNLAQDKVTSDDAACTPLAYVAAASYVGKPAATVKRSWTGEAEKPGAGAGDEEKALAVANYAKAVETLTSYDGGGAEQAMKDLKTAVEKCAGGFSYTADGTKLKIVKVATTSEPGGADQALAVTLTVATDEGMKAPMKAVVVRKGAVLAHFPVINFASLATGKDFAFPTQLVDAQLAKLG
ncbi:MAG: hypothetical protein LBV60_16220 [Streptomyces sp.]|jgi:hypothetical protein|nr:hypothetical protein [Streptomyces sp.]